ETSICAFEKKTQSVSKRNACGLGSGIAVKSTPVISAYRTEKIPKNSKSGRKRICPLFVKRAFGRLNPKAINSPMDFHFMLWSPQHQMTLPCTNVKNHPIFMEIIQYPTLNFGSPCGNLGHSYP
ncbi:hypothetical protein AVEN_274167-1, partial [Araneus ventricosus]